MTDFVSRHSFAISNNFRITLYFFRCPIAELTWVESAIDDPHLRFILIQSIEHSECLSTNDLVITIDPQDDVLLATEIVHSIHDVIGAPVLLKVLDEGDFAEIELKFLKQIVGRVECGILRSVINKDDMVVGIVLLDDAQHDPFISIVLHIVVGGNDEAHR